MKKKLLASVLLAASLVTLGAVSAARAEPLPIGTTILETVDGVTAQNRQSNSSNVALRVEGLVQGESQARELDLDFYQSFNGADVPDRCMKLLLLAQTHPGRYLVVLRTLSNVNLVTSCKLKSR